MAYPARAGYADPRMVQWDTWKSRRSIHTLSTQRYGMVWAHWGSRQLQEELSSFEDGLYQQVMDTVPPLMGEDFDPISLERKIHLVELIKSFAPSDYFAKRARMERCLDLLPPPALADLVRDVAQALDVARPAPNFEDRKRWLLRKRWSDERFARAFLAHFDLPIISFPPRRWSESMHSTSIPSVHPELVAPSPIKPLKDYQWQARRRSACSCPRSRFIVQMPTGSGKTRRPWRSSLITSAMRRQGCGRVVGALPRVVRAGLPVLSRLAPHGQQTPHRREGRAVTLTL